MKVSPWNPREVHDDLGNTLWRYEGIHPQDVYDFVANHNAKYELQTLKNEVKTLEIEIDQMTVELSNKEDEIEELKKEVVNLQDEIEQLRNGNN